MIAKTPRVLRQVKIDGKWQKLPVAKVNGKLDWGYVMHKGERILAPSGTFYLEYKDAGVKVRRAVGDNVRDAKAAIVSQGSVLELRARGVETDDAPEIHVRRKLEGKRIKEVVDAFCSRPPLGLRPTTLTKYTFDLRSFEEWARRSQKTHLSQLGRQEIRDFMVYLVREQGLELKTAVNKAVIVLKQMRDAGAEIKMQKGDWPRVTEEQPDIYTPEMLRPLFAAMTPREYVLYMTFLLTGFRDQEVGFLARPDFNPQAATLKVSKKAGHKFDPKNYMERTIPIVPQLVELLEDHVRKLDAKEYFLFATTMHNVGKGLNGGQRDKHMLIKLKRVALRAGMNCGRCEAMFHKQPASCKDKPICRRWTLHKFRHTYATTLLHLGFDILTVQRLLGHRKIESTMKYLRMLQPESLRLKMDASELAAKCVG